MSERTALMVAAMYFRVSLREKLVGEHARGRRSQRLQRVLNEWPRSCFLSPREYGELADMLPGFRQILHDSPLHRESCQCDACQCFDRLIGENHAQPKPEEGKA